MPPLFFIRVLPLTAWIPIDGAQYLAALLSMETWPHLNDGTAVAVIDPDDAIGLQHDCNTDPPPLIPRMP
jgi:hypothetical protein